MSRWLRYLLATILILVLVADFGYRAWNERPYVVTGISSQMVANNQRLAVRYSLPGGESGGLWEADGNWIKDFWCWDKAEVGKTIPHCMRANWKARDTNP